MMTFFGILLAAATFSSIGMLFVWMIDRACNSNDYYGLWLFGIFFLFFFIIIGGIVAGENIKDKKTDNCVCTQEWKGE